MSKATETDRPSVPEQQRGFSAVALGFFSLIPVLIVTVAQTLNIGYTYAVGSAVPLSDSALWSSCASALAGGHESVYLNWCLKRPLLMFAQAPFFIASPSSVAAVVILQVLALSLALWLFVVSMVSSFKLGRASAVLVLALCMWPILIYGTHLGAEAPALILSLVAGAAMLRFLSSDRLRWGIVCSVATILVFQIRPGNAPLTLTIAAGFVFLLWRRSRQILLTTGIAVLLVAVWLLPTPIMKAAGWSEAGHASNFWSVAYAAATPSEDSWAAAYDHFAPEFGCTIVSKWTADPCMAIEGEAFGSLLKDQTLALIRENPAPLVHRLVSNEQTLADEGFINRMWGAPVSPPWHIWRAADRQTLTQPGSRVLSAVALLGWIASWAFPLLLIFGLFRMQRLRGSPLSIDRRFNVVRLSLLVAGITVVGVVGTFALVGFDDPQRHMVQSIPFIVIGVAALAAVPWRSTSVWREQEPPIARSALWARVAIGAIIAVVAVTSVVEGRRSSQRMNVLINCDAGRADPISYEVVASQSLNSSLPGLGPAAWRNVGSTPATYFIPQQFVTKWVRETLGALPPGQLLDLRSNETGDIITAYVSDSDWLAVGPGGWCERVPSALGSDILVRDLVPVESP